MKLLTFSYKKTAGIEQPEINNHKSIITREITTITNALTANYQSPYASINLPTDTALFSHVQDIVKEKKKLNPSTLILIGIGGSNLGTLAVHEAINGKLYNEKSDHLKLYNADTVDATMLNDMILLVEKELQQKKNIIINVISKSGSTTETIANFELFLTLLKKYRPNDFAQYVVVTTDQHSRFAHYATEQKYTLLEIPTLVGGRFSVFSPVGLFPLGMLNIDCAALIRGAQETITSCIAPDIGKNDAALSALLKYIHYKQCINIHDLFLFAPQLASFGLWYRQLMGESIGKELNRHNQRVEVGITPTVSIGSTDLHSVGQLYLGGPRDKFTTFITVNKTNALTVPSMPEFEQFVPRIQGKKIETIMHAIATGVQEAYVNNKRPFCTISIEEIDAKTIGALMQFYMIEIMYLAYLFEVNPFDQPNVETYKQETRKILANS